MLLRYGREGTKMGSEAAPPPSMGGEGGGGELHGGEADGASRFPRPVPSDLGI